MKLTLTPILTALLLQQGSVNVNAFSVLPSSSSSSLNVIKLNAEESSSSSSSESGPTLISKPIPKPVALTPVPVSDDAALAEAVEKEEVETTAVVEETKDESKSEIESTPESESKPESKPEPKAEKTIQEIMSVPVIQRLSDSIVTSVATNEQINLSTYLQSPDANKSMIVFGTYAADFNAIEYVQRLRYYLPQLQAKGVDKIGLVLNCEAEAAKKLVTMLELETDATTRKTTTAAIDNDVVVELFIDPKGESGRAFGVGTGWRPNDEEMSPYVKLFGMLFGLGAWATLPAVIGGYIGNPYYGQPWIEDALAIGQMKGRWPQALDMDEDTGEVAINKFTELPVVGSWERRPLELATLRLQNMVDISIKNWGELAPKEDALEAGVLTQLGGCVVVNAKSGEEITRWRDPGICAVANFEDILKNID
jgi:hypothetical protein